MEWDISLATEPASVRFDDVAPPRALGAELWLRGKCFEDRCHRAPWGNGAGQRVRGVAGQESDSLLDDGLKGWGID